MSTFRQEVMKYEKLCEVNGVPEETVMSYLVELSQRERYDLYANYDEEMPADLQKEFAAGMERILKQEPMAHVLGYSWFYGYKFIVNENVLFPRYETEELCANVLGEMDRYFADQNTIECADVGTGSGAIANTLCKEEPKVHMTATDISEEALLTARQNAANNDADVTFLCGDMVKPLIEKGMKLDVLVCNPPYNPQEEKMEKSVVDFEPHVALFGGEDGLKFYREVFEDCQKVLKEKAFMAFEMGWDQRERMSALLEEKLPGWRYEIRRDINGKDRMLFVYRNLG